MLISLFARLGLDSPLLGDLVEERAHGRSLLWLAKQLIAAFCINLFKTIAGHKLLALRAILTGSALNYLWFFLWTHFLRIGYNPKPGLSRESALALLLILLTEIGTGWVVARTHRTHAFAMVLVFSIWLAAWYFISSFSEMERLAINSIDQPRFRPYLAMLLTPFFIEMAGLFFGGLLGARPIPSTDLISD